jgi:aspartyl/asparaginyl-tRNA synthetase
MSSSIIPIKDVSLHVGKIITIKGTIINIKRLRKVSFMTLTDDNSQHKICVIITNNLLIPNNATINTIQVTGKISGGSNWSGHINYFIAV